MLHNLCPGGRGKRSGDCDADGKSDGGYAGGVNEYGKGVVEFCRTLRQKLGDKKIIQADGVSGVMGDGAQRAFGILNGIESEGWPFLNDPEIRDWSGGLNRHFFWDENARPPVFNYINHKYIERGIAPAEKILPDVPFKVHRLVFAAACFTNAAICYSYPPKNDAGGQPGIWDELRMGAENRLAWLGKPLGPAARQAARQPDLLKGTGAPVSDDLLKRLTSDDAAFEIKDGAIRMAARDPNAEEFHARLRDVPCDGPDLTIFVTARAEQAKEYPPEMARIMYLSLAAPGKQFAVKATPPKGKRRPADPAEFMTHLNQNRFMAGFYFNHAAAPKADLEFRIERAAPVWIERITLHAHPDAIYREFEHGLVLANPSPRSYTFEIEKLFPGKQYRRLKATANQDTKANDGSPVGGRITLESLEGLFLARQ
ncbi:MAG: hypothetical protein NTX50_32220 [Candidatus Sumerlaeota bacterium]|nr:hypothetical protein [Candidatus Sumerlaeota bacterium]